MQRPHGSFALGILLSICLVFPVYANDTPWWQYSSNAKQIASQTLSSTRTEHVPIPILFGFDVDTVPNDFGVPRSGGRTHEGIDFIAPLRAPIISPTDAVVHSKGVGDSAGLYVYTHNPGGEVFAYLHLDEIAPELERGDTLKAGDLIGYVGTTGNATGGAPHLHFEIRDDVALDPHTRVTDTFSLQEKLQFLEHILASFSASYAEELAARVALHYEDELREAQAMGLLLPSSVEAKLGTVSVEDLAQSAQSTGSASNPSIGTEGNEVTILQQFLIQTNAGSAARALADVGATGYFGSLTTAALAEFQAHANLSQTSGVYDEFTRAYIKYISGGILSVPSQTDTPKETAPVPVSKPTINLAGMPQHDMTDGRRGSDVVWLQNFLIEKNIGVATTALAQVGATGYYGSLTVNALAEYQKHAGISPASGYYGKLTRAHLLINK